MRKKKTLWSGVSILIVAALVITAFIRGKGLQEYMGSSFHSVSAFLKMYSKSTNAFWA